MNNILIILFIALQQSPPQPSPDFKKTTVICKEINYTYTINGYKYPGININGKNYLTNEKNYDTLVSKIEKECY